jgi:hypothetical protein
MPSGTFEVDSGFLNMAFGLCDIADILFSTEPDPADFTTVCGKDATKVASGISSACTGSDAQAALTAFSSSCSAAGHPICRLQSLCRLAPKILQICTD